MTHDSTLEPAPKHMFGVAAVFLPQSDKASFLVLSSLAYGLWGWKPACLAFAVYFVLCSQMFSVPLPFVVLV